MEGRTVGTRTEATSLLVALGYELLKSSFARLFTEEGV